MSGGHLGPIRGSLSQVVGVAEEEEEEVRPPPPPPPRRGRFNDDPDVIKGRAGSPYAVKDYYNVNPDLARNPAKRLEEFKALIERTHRHGLKVMIAGMGPAGFTLAHHLLLEGFAVVGFDGLKIEPLPKDVSGVGPLGDRTPFRPLRDVSEIFERLVKV